MFTVDRVTGEEILDIFGNRFEVDRNLPKYTVEKDAVTQSISYGMQSGGSNFTSTIFTINGNSTNSSMLASNSIGMWNSQNVSPNWASDDSKDPSIKKTLFSKFKGLFKKKKTDVRKVFELVFSNFQQVELAAERLEKYKKVIADAKRNGQTAFAETLEKEYLRNVGESGLVATGSNRFLESKDLIRFYKECEKGLSLTWIKNFVRKIPDDVLALKEEADKLKLFDNYVILHYDPLQKAHKLTEKEIEKKKDPILFGVFKESNRLYVIGDWEDEFCDLTFDKLVDTLKLDESKTKLQD